MSWMIGRAEAMNDPLAARRKVMDLLRGLAELDDPEASVVPILIDAILLVESYRGARHPIPFVDELHAQRRRDHARADHRRESQGIRNLA